MRDYLLYEQSNAALAPVHAASGAMRSLCKNSLNPRSYTFYGRALAAGCEFFEHYTRAGGDRGFDITSTIAGGKLIPATIVWQRPFAEYAISNR
jgi:poly(3-hydroxybutyrate) depolymerase